MQGGMIIFNYKGVNITMVKEYINKLDFKCIHFFICAVFVIHSLFGCGNKRYEEDGEEDENIRASVLQEFSIIDSKVDSVTKLVIRELYPPKRRVDETMALGFNLMKNDTIDLMYSFHYRKDNELSNVFIPINNKRVVGYVTIEGVDIILLSNINKWTDLTKTLSKMIKPASNSKVFDNVVYSNYTYKRYWNYEIIGYEPLCWHFKYKDGVVSKPSGYLGY